MEEKYESLLSLLRDPVAFNLKLYFSRPLREEYFTSENVEKKRFKNALVSKLSSLEELALELEEYPSWKKAVDEWGGLQGFQADPSVLPQQLYKTLTELKEVVEKTQPSQPASTEERELWNRLVYNLAVLDAVLNHKDEFNDYVQGLMDKYKVSTGLAHS